MIRFLVLILISVNTYAQKNEISVVYKQIFDNHKKVERTAYLYANDEMSLFEDDLINYYKKEIIENDKKQAELDKQNSGSNKYIRNILPDIKYNTFIKFSRSTNEIQYIEQVIKDRYVLITDEARQKWELTQERKIIDNIECFKATTKFRGLDWEVWYAPSIPYPYGPWKLHGLPGLIISANDVNKRYNFSATKIEFIKNEILQKQLTDLVNETIADKVTLQRFVEMRDEIVAAPLITERDGITRRNTNTRAGKEPTYEWEEAIKE